MNSPTILIKAASFLFAIFMMLAPIFAFSAASNSETCERIVDKSGDDWSIAIWEPGQYCIGQDLSQSDPIFRLPHQAVPKDPLLLIRHGSVVANLNQHHLKTRVIHREGLWVKGFKNSPIRSVAIQNGFISTTSGPTVFMADTFDDGTDRRYGMNFSIASSKGDLTKYRSTEFVLENLTLEGDNHVIIMQGKNNIIRHCKIVGGNGTINVFGPQLVFEDNEIILHAKAQASADDEAPVALYLEDAADSIVRNNHIVIEGRTPGSGAIVLRNSPNVTITGNTVTGTDTVYKQLDERSSVTATGNTLRR